ncbi:hypothetical protein ILUMI_18173, partial [Ignelater luminosus]
YYGVYNLTRPILVIRDPDLIKKVTVKWFEAFGDHRDFAPKYADPIWARNIFSTRIEDGWHDLRTTVSPFFTSSKLKMMFGLMQKCAEQCVEHYKKQGGFVTIEAKDMVSRYTADVIGTTIFGVTCNSYDEPENEFRMMTKQAADFTGLKASKFLGYSLIPRIMQLFQIRLFNQTLVKFYSGLLNESIKLRREKKLIRTDMIHLFMESQKGQLNDDDQSIDTEFSAVDESDILRKWKKRIKFGDTDITGVGLGFFFAGFGTTSYIMSFLAYELAANPDIQEKLFEEVSAALQNDDGKITYEALLKIKYLDMVVAEALRKWPSDFYFDRECIVPFTIEPENEHEGPLHIEKGTQCFIPILGIHRDSKYHPNPEKFDPERFSDENKHNIRPFTYMPFGMGPRNCVASRFALLETKLLFAEIIRAFEIVILDKMKIPLNIKAKGFNYYPEGGIWLGLKPRVFTT